MMSSSHVLMVRSLYKRILKLHHGLPIEMKAIGDQYVKSEFKNHKTAKEEEVKIFIAEWMNYAKQLEEQLSRKSSLGSSIDVSRLDSFRPEQIGQLYELHVETKKPSQFIPPENIS
ncbi:succinate dehydrogenase assembly factor 3, mitochondrial-like [Antedon mediterranea]|uniref:succinate dehydrogenase assembly factor 3, mitochondrial-like n=1 Tax=Antedon mediterranea TaxID=105859 RepID=UPI003AF76881